jgi:hypothetical protein
MLVFGLILDLSICCARWIVFSCRLAFLFCGVGVLLYCGVSLILF